MFPPALQVRHSTRTIQASFRRREVNRRVAERTRQREEREAREQQAVRAKLMAEEVGWLVSGRPKGGGGGCMW